MKVLVAGATGTQGGSVVEHLLSGAYGDYDVYGLTRDADSDAARALESRGVTVLEGDLTDAARMRECCEGMDAVFCVTTFFEAGTDAETAQGITLVEAAKEAGVERFVYSSVGSADAAPLAHFASKARVEERIEELGFDYTVVRPVYFMQNLASFQAEEIADGTVTIPMSPDTPLALLDATDIGKTVAMALADPERFVGTTVELAGDNRTPAEIAAALSDVVGHDVAHVRPDIDDYRAMAGDEMADMYAWFEEGGYGANPMADAETYGIEPNDFETFLSESEAFRSSRPVAS
ncbi:NmrA/HSCARG family protein [Salinirubellus salinus]|uniref:NmrA/HSCARG family protein n=1 Tax=Salinirubellus salinus TaxID=1364945 RepID=A0A9E7R3R4_9EURY|nr:NmrA/HSCARG family protein [Salinirubellus salinus]UWM54883.1 NmrA/HSCARG family protein [Salinirubellus salinus]